MLKVALINNMNNNFFALARYLRDKNIDAHVFQVDPLDDHFRPECDTFEDVKSCPYIHYIANISFKDFFRIPFSLKMQRQLKKLNSTLRDFDIIVACGGLAILELANIKVDIFVPYGNDLYCSPFLMDYCSKKYFPYPLLLNRYVKFQRRAIAKTRAIVTFGSIDLNLNGALTKLNEKWIDWAIPAVYPLANIKTDKWDFLDKYDFIVFSHTRQAWITLDKGNDKAIRAFDQFIKIQKKFSNPIMVLFEYGPDVQASKKLIEELGLSNYIVWMPTMERKYIYEGLKKASLVFDYFGDKVVSFGGVAYESFCHSIPVIGTTTLGTLNVKHSIPLIHAYSIEDIVNVFLEYSVNPEKYIQHAKEAKLWFDENVGSGLVDKFTILMEYLVANKTISLKDPNFNLPPIMQYIKPDINNELHQKRAI